MNKFILDRDVLRYDVDNKVTAWKNISNLVTNNLKIKNNMLLQDVDLQEWMREAVRINGSTAIKGLCIFENETEFSMGLRYSNLVPSATKMHNEFPDILVFPGKLTGCILIRIRCL